MTSHTGTFMPDREDGYPLRWNALIALLLGTAIAAAIGALASIAAPSFYTSLNRPDWAPPAGLFGPMWTLLYALMAIAAWIVVRVEGWPDARRAMRVYAVQLLANALWTWLFFRWQSGAASFVGIIVLWVLIAVTLTMFWRVHPLAGALLMPYLAWVTFAGLLTWYVWSHNPGVL